jgi:hypothetical protein
MRGLTTASLVALLLSTATLSGCIQGAFRPAEVGTLAPGWGFVSDDSEGGEKGLQPLVVAKFQVNVYQELSNYPGELYVISVSDVPLLDEQAEIKKQLDAKLAEKNVQLTGKGTGTGTVAGNDATFTYYDGHATFSGVSITGFAIDLAYTCKANGEAVRVFGLAATESPGGLLGGGHSEATWQDIVGGSFPGSLGGMIASIRCS